jgi:cyclophilin family peptidyl-prolyl cis-trans isomerase/protein-disulfide isomerase
MLRHAEYAGHLPGPPLPGGWAVALILPLLAACVSRTPAPPSAPPASETPAPTLTPLRFFTDTPGPPGANTVTPSPTQPSLFAPVTASDWQIGPSEASVTLVVYSDFQCYYCGTLAPLLRQLLTEFPDDLRLVFRHYPLPQDDKAQLAAAAAEAAGAQGKFWEMHDLLFGQQADWAELELQAFPAQLDAYAADLELDLEAFSEVRDNPETAAVVQIAYEIARDIPLPYAPFLLINGTPIQDAGLANHYALSTLIRLEALKAQQYADPPPDVIDPFLRYEATIVTGHGDIVIELFAELTPLTVNNFVFLAREGWYDGVTFHRVIPGWAAQAGDPSGTGYGGPGYFIPDEIVSELRFDGAGWVGMANAGPDTNGSQFFITLGAIPEFDGRYTLFGRVVAGLEAVELLSPRDPNIEAEAPPGDVIQTITIEEK